MGLTRIRCPYCRAYLDPAEKTCRCSECQTRYHFSCWIENGNCAVYGCAGRCEEPKRAILVWLAPCIALVSLCNSWTMAALSFVMIPALIISLFSAFYYGVMMVRLPQGNRFMYAGYTFLNLCPIVLLYYLFIHVLVGAK
ncbi:MAG: hypothetical protein C5B54_08925 [Acidobacteria bacterium]|nr:MAG: hypothetical protein C5B54_08925 [Acidobacteriota bacterium]